LKPAGYAEEEANAGLATRSYCLTLVIERSSTIRQSVSPKIPVTCTTNDVNSARFEIACRTPCKYAV
jgi:hypothetical protein